MSRTILSNIQFILIVYEPRNLKHIDSSLLDSSFSTVKKVVWLLVKETFDLWQT
jgi:hypothetical protein